MKNHFFFPGKATINIFKFTMAFFLFMPMLGSAQTFDLTGFWQSDVGACYQVRQKGNEIVWIDEPTMNSYAYNAFYGIITGNIIKGKWYDMPSNSQNNFGESMTIQIENDSRLVKISESKPYNGSVLTKLNGPCGSSYATPEVVQEKAKGKIYFFKGSEYIRFDIAADKADPGYPKTISSATWNGLWTSGIDAAVNFGNGKIYFFKGSEYICFNIAADKADPGYPKPISNWKLAWTGGLDAAVNGGNGKIYFFKGSEYVRFDIAADKADPGYPKTISSATWNGVWTSGIDAAVNYGNGKIFLFKGSEYIRFDIAADKADPGYPQPISNWKLIWTAGIDAAISIY
jgi:hypothetical protein